MTDTAPVFRFESASLSSPGRVRTINEDACLDLGRIGLWAVADGMGGHHAGDVASRMVVDTLSELCWRAELGEFADEVEQRLVSVNRELIGMAQARGPDAVIGSTVAVLLGIRRHGMCLWVGDSRIYRRRGGVLHRLSRDHSEFEDLLDQGLVQIDEADTHPSSNVITRAVGGEPELQLDSVRIELQHEDRFLLCSDGLYKELHEEEIGGILGRGDCKEACSGLVDLALQRGSRDNVTVVVVEFHESW